MTYWPHPSDERWSLTSRPQPSISVIEPDPTLEHSRRMWESVMLDETKTQRAPFGFARAGLEDERGRPLCGYPHRNARAFGGCILRHGHDGGHQHGTGTAKLPFIRPTKHVLNGGHPYQRPGQESPDDPPAKRPAPKRAPGAKRPPAAPPAPPSPPEEPGDA